MRVVLVNGSPHEHGCTRRALDEVASALAADGIEPEFLSIGTAPVRGCIACGKCSTLGRCVFDDKVNEFLDRAHDADGFVFGTPVHYASAAGAITSFLDRAFYAADTSASGPLYLKPAAAVASARRAGAPSGWLHRATRRRGRTQGFSCSSSSNARAAGSRMKQALSAPFDRKLQMLARIMP